MTRRLDWEQRLTTYLDSVRDKPFEWGRHDCAIHTANAVRAMTGRDFARGFRGKYRSAASSIRVLRGLGFDDLPALVTARLGEPIPAAFAQRGDVVLADDGSLGICVGPNAFLVGQEGELNGLLMVHRRAWSKAWRVA